MVCVWLRSARAHKLPPHATKPQDGEARPGLPCSCVVRLLRMGSSARVAKPIRRYKSPSRLGHIFFLGRDEPAEGAPNVLHRKHCHPRKVECTPISPFSPTNEMYCE